MYENIGVIENEIIKLLVVNGREQQSFIAEQVNISPTTVSNKIKGLVEDGFILKFSCVLDYSRLGFSTVAYIYVSLTDKTVEPVKKFIEYASSFVEVVEAHKLIGEHDFIILTRSKNNDTYQEFIEKFNEWENISNATSHIASQIVIDGGNISKKELEDN